MNRILFLLFLCAFLKLSAMVKPEKETYLNRLPPELFIEVARYDTGPSVHFSHDITRFYDIYPESKSSVQINKALLSDIMRKSNFTTGKELQELVDNLKKIRYLPVFENPDMKKWIGQQKKRFFYENELREAANCLDVKKVKELIKKGINVNARNKHDRTPLMLAISSRRLSSPIPTKIEERINEIISLLIAAGAEVNARNDQGNTALIYAAANALVDSVEMLLKNKSDPNLASYTNGATPLWDSLGVIFNAASPALRQNYKKIAKMLLEAGADPNAPIRGGSLSRSLNDATQLAFNPITVEERDEILNLLRQYGFRE